MLILNNMKKTAETDNRLTFSCEFCKRKFSRERTLVSHLCEYKQRWLHKDHPGNRLGFHSWMQFYEKNSMSRTKNKTYEEFIRSPYYTAFAKFGSYCVDVNIINVPAYTNWLLKENVKIDNWNTDSNYTKFLIYYLRNEDAFDAIHRSVETCINLGKDDNIQPNDVLRYSNPNKLCHVITTGKISPWLLFQSESGVQFLKTLNQDHVTLILDYINPEQWTIKFNRESELARQIKDTLRQAGY